VTADSVALDRGTVRFHALRAQVLSENQRQDPQSILVIALKVWWTQWKEHRWYSKQDVATVVTPHKPTTLTSPRALSGARYECVDMLTLKLGAPVVESLALLICIGYPHSKH
jgi:hypothetical protein